MKKLMWAMVVIALVVGVMSCDLMTGEGEGVSRAVVVQNSIGFHHGGKVDIKNYKQGTKVDLVFNSVTKTEWTLPVYDYECPVCERLDWSSFSNNAKAPSGNNVQLAHTTVPAYRCNQVDCDKIVFGGARRCPPCPGVCDLCDYKCPTCEDCGNKSCICTCEDDHEIVITIVKVASAFGGSTWNTNGEGNGTSPQRYNIPGLDITWLNGNDVELRIKVIDAELAPAAVIVKSRSNKDIQIIIGTGAPSVNGSQLFFIPDGVNYVYIVK